jgi:hypothetical protein
VALRENSVLAVQTLWDRKFRSFLTMFGVFIGVVIIVVVASVLNGFRQSVVDQVQEFGTNTIYVYRFSIGAGGGDDDERLAQEAHARGRLGHPRPVPVGAGRLARAGHSERPDLARYKGEEMSAPSLRGAYPESLDVSNGVLAEGRFLSAGRERPPRGRVRRRLQIVDALFPRLSPIGKADRRRRAQAAGHRRAGEAQGGTVRLGERRGRRHLRALQHLPQVVPLRGRPLPRRAGAQRQDPRRHRRRSASCCAAAAA